MPPQPTRHDGQVSDVIVRKVMTAARGAVLRWGVSGRNPSSIEAALGSSGSRLRPSLRCFDPRIDSATHKGAKVTNPGFDAATLPDVRRLPWSQECLDLSREPKPGFATSAHGLVTFAHGFVTFACCGAGSASVSVATGVTRQGTAAIPSSRRNSVDHDDHPDPPTPEPLPGRDSVDHDDHPDPPAPEPIQHTRPHEAPENPANRHFQGQTAKER